MSKDKDDEWIGICPDCGRFHRDHGYCAGDYDKKDDDKEDDKNEDDDD